MVELKRPAGTELTDLTTLVECIKQEILADIQAGVVPASVSSFAQLHDYVDANCYGGVCEDENYAALLWHFTGRTGRPDPAVAEQIETMPDAMSDYLSRAHAQIDAWLKAGRGLHQQER